MSLKLWNSVFISSNKELNTTQRLTADAVYEEYRDELDDFVTIEN